MTAEQINDIVEKVYTKASAADLSKFPEKLAVQFNLVGRCKKFEGVFYLEVLNGVLSVKPYEYIDRDGLITLSKTSLEEILKKKITVEAALAGTKVEAEGDMDKLMLLKNLL